MRLTYNIITYNRRENVLQTLTRLAAVTPLPQADWEIIVVDNASTDGSADAIAERFPQVRLIRNSENEGMSARNHAFTGAKGQYIISLDDDSYPTNFQSIQKMLSHMDGDPKVGALVARVVMPDGQMEAPALPAVVMGGATCYRKSVLDKVGGFRKEFFRQAEEYDLSFRIWHEGHRIERREDVIFMHQKLCCAGRDEAMVRQLDLRNNLIIANRFFPAKLKHIYWHDWRQRYEAMAREVCTPAAIKKALSSARHWVLREKFRKHPVLSPAALEAIFGLRRQSELVGQWSRQKSVWRVVIADFGKNLWATYNACRSTGLQIRCVADENPSFHDLHYRGLPVVTLRQALDGGGIDGIVCATINPAQVDRRIAWLQSMFKGPVLRLYDPSAGEQRQPIAA